MLSGDFADPLCVKMVPALEKNFVTYTVQITEVNGIKWMEIQSPNHLPIHAYPFGTRIHILSNSESKVKVGSEPFTVQRR